VTTPSHDIGTIKNCTTFSLVKLHMSLLVTAVRGDHSGIIIPPHDFCYFI
jgi:hypothetical protein